VWAVIASEEHWPLHTSGEGVYDQAGLSVAGFRSGDLLSCSESTIHEGVLGQWERSDTVCVGDNSNRLSMLMMTGMNLEPSMLTFSAHVS
jgi:hypothetical protein